MLLSSPSNERHRTERVRQKRFASLHRLVINLIKLQMILDALSSLSLFRTTPAITKRSAQPQQVRAGQRKTKETLT
jgi:hypothetical protein